ncbi:hypothetical protein L211DRAFT_888144, partial [Terfezia boudieri ATCC MYA-4762]
MNRSVDVTRTTCLPGGCCAIQTRLPAGTVKSCYTGPRYSGSLVIPDGPEASGFLTSKFPLPIPDGHTIPDRTECWRSAGVFLSMSLYISPSLMPHFSL